MSTIVRHLPTHGRLSDLQVSDLGPEIRYIAPMNDLVEPWQLRYFAEAMARGLPISEAAGCGALSGTQEELAALARREDVRLMLIACLRDRAALSGADAERAMLRADAWVSILACRSRKDERNALAWSKWYAELGGVGAPTDGKAPLASVPTPELEAEVRARIGRLRVVGGGGGKPGGE